MIKQNILKIDELHSSIFFYGKLNLDNIENHTFRIRRAFKSNGDIVYDYETDDTSKEKFLTNIDLIYFKREVIIQKKDFFNFEKIEFGICHEMNKWYDDLCITINISDILEKKNITFYSDLWDYGATERLPIKYGLNLLDSAGVSYLGGEKYSGSQDFVRKNASTAISKNIMTFCYHYSLKNFKDSFKIRHAVFEADELPDEWVSSFRDDNLDCFVVPDPWVKDLFLKYFKDTNIHIIPEGVESMNIKKVFVKNKFTFGFTSIFESRKNHLFLIKAFKKAFQNDNKFRLKIHGKVGDLYEECAKEAAGCRNIEISNKILSDHEMKIWWNDIDCYINPSQGEGFSHTPRESLMLGIPTIVGNWSAHESLVKSGGVYSINPSGFEPAFKKIFNKSVGRHAIYKEDDLCDLMLYVTKNFNVAKEKALIGRKYVLENNNWNKSAKLLYGVLKND